MDNKLQDVRTTMRVANQPIQNYPAVPGRSVMETGLRLEFEELLEKAIAMGLAGTFGFIVEDITHKKAKEAFEQQKYGAYMVSTTTYNFYDTGKVDLKEVFDATIDQQVVLNWTTNAMGMQGIVDEGWERVNDNNMTKFPVDPEIELVEATISHYEARGIKVHAEISVVDDVPYTVFKNEKGKYLKPAGFVPVELGDIVESAIEAGVNVEKQSK